MTKLAHSSHFMFKIFPIEIYFQKSSVEWHSQHLNHQKTPKPVFRNTIPNVFARLRRHLGFFYLGSSHVCNLDLLYLCAALMSDTAGTGFVSPFEHGGLNSISNGKSQQNTHLTCILSATYTHKKILRAKILMQNVSLRQIPPRNVSHER